MSCIRLVLWDLGNVLVHVDISAFWRSLEIAEPAVGDPCRQRLEALSGRYETGLLDTDDYIEGLRAELREKPSSGRLQTGNKTRSELQGHPREFVPDQPQANNETWGEFQSHRREFTSEQLRVAFRSIIGDPVAGMEALVSQVLARVPGCLASNTNPIHHEQCQSQLPILQHMARHYVSYCLHVLKPAAAFYQAIVRDYDLDPATVLLIDDSTANVAGAEACGLQAIRFQDAVSLEAVLRKLEVV